MRKPARALLIGTGFGAQHAEWISHCDKIELSVIAFARRESAARELAARYGAPYITKEPLEYIRQNLVDLVCIVSPPPTHEALLITCLNHGLPTMCDKPLSDTLAGARRIAEAWRHANAPTYSMFQWRLHPAVQALKAILSAGQDWSQITLSFEHDFLAASESPWIWRHTGGMGGGAMSDLGAHLADLLLYLTPFGWEVDSAEMNVDRPVRRAPDGTTFVCSSEDTALVHLHNDANTHRAILHCSRVSSGRRRIQVAASSTSRQVVLAIDPETSDATLTFGGQGTRAEVERFENVDLNPYRILQASLLGEHHDDELATVKDGLAAQLLVERAVAAHCSGDAPGRTHHSNGAAHVECG